MNCSLPQVLAVSPVGNLFESQDTYKGDTIKCHHPTVVYVAIFGDGRGQWSYARSFQAGRVRKRRPGTLQLVAVAGLALER